MNPFLIGASLLLLLACPVHAILGDRENRQLRPVDHQPDLVSYWITGRCVFHMATTDLLLSGCFILLMGLGTIPCSATLVLFFAILNAIQALAWLLTVRVSGGVGREYLKQGQWILFMLVSILLFSGSCW